RTTRTCGAEATRLEIEGELEQHRFQRRGASNITLAIKRHVCVPMRPRQEDRGSTATQHRRHITVPVRSCGDNFNHNPRKTSTDASFTTITEVPLLSMYALLSVQMEPSQRRVTQVQNSPRVVGRVTGVSAGICPPNEARPRYSGRSVWYEASPRRVRLRSRPVRCLQTRTTKH